MSVIEKRMAELDLVLPEVAAPVAAYVPAVRVGSVVYTSGQLPILSGQLIEKGRVGRTVSPERAAECAGVCLLNTLSATKALIGDLDRIDQVIKLVGFVASDPEFSNQSLVVNGASKLLEAIFGPVGKHARSAVGVAVLPLNAPVEVELVVSFR